MIGELLETLRDALGTPSAVWTQTFMVSGVFGFAVHLATGGSAAGFHDNLGAAWAFTLALMATGLWTHACDPYRWNYVFRFRFVRGIADSLFKR